VNGLHTLHGRPVAAAQGIKLANHDLKVVVTSGDGDSYGIGTGHFVHAMRRNADITHMVQNNRVYGLTKGQYSPTSEKGFVTSTTPEGAVEPALNPLAAALAHGSTFVARGSAGEPVHLANLMARAIEHRGHALVDILQPCVVFNRDADYDFYRERTYKLEDTEHDPENLDQAWQKA
jgi:2-oxoglutarate ferredoxin oxidoreductase subunit beta